MIISTDCFDEGPYSLVVAIKNITLCGHRSQFSVFIISINTPKMCWLLVAILSEKVAVESDTVVVHCSQNVTGTCGFLDLDPMKFGRTKSPQQQKHINR